MNYMTGKRRAIATLLYSADYLPGVFTLGRQLRKLGAEGGIKTPLLLLVSRDLYQDVLSEFSIEILHRLFTNIIVVNPIQGPMAGNIENLKLLQRPELSFTLVKARLWELDYDEVLYLDSDTLPLSPDIFKLFDTYPLEKDEVAAAPDVGWPDMFNSGVLLLSPDKELAYSLRRFIASNISIDGADQGILNQFFNANCRKSECGEVNQKWVRLPFIYNVTMPNYGYESSPAIKFFEHQVKLVHFIGEKKPWRGSCGNSKSNAFYSSQWNKAFLDFQTEYSLSQNMSDLELKPTSSALNGSQSEIQRDHRSKRETGSPVWRDSSVQSEQVKNMNRSEREPGFVGFSSWKESPVQSKRVENTGIFGLEPSLPAPRKSPAKSEQVEDMTKSKSECNFPSLSARKETSSPSEQVKDINLPRPEEALPAWQKSVVQSKQEPERVFPDESPRRPAENISARPVTATAQPRYGASNYSPVRLQGAISSPNVERVFPEDYGALERG